MFPPFKGLFAPMCSSHCLLFVVHFSSFLMKHNKNGVPSRQWCTFLKSALFSYSPFAVVLFASVFAAPQSSQYRNVFFFPSLNSRSATIPFSRAFFPQHLFFFWRSNLMDGSSTSRPQQWSYRKNEIVLRQPMLGVYKWTFFYSLTPFFNKHVLNCLFAFLFYPFSAVLVSCFSCFRFSLATFLFLWASVPMLAKKPVLARLKKKKHVDTTAFQKQSKKGGSTPAR